MEIIYIAVVYNKLIIVLNENWYSVSKLLEWYLQVKNLKFESSSCIGSCNSDFITYVSVQCFFFYCK